MLELPKGKEQPVQSIRRGKWMVPPDGVVKLNSDGAICLESGLASTGVVVREGLNFRGAGGKMYRGISDPLVIEALALRDAALYAVEKGFGIVMFEVDCLELVKLWNNRSMDRSVIKSVLDEINELGSSFQSFSICFARREANQAAHSCAKFVVLQERDCFWEAEPPLFLVQRLRTDCNDVTG